jgi:hypothetical protein
MGARAFAVGGFPAFVRRTAFGRALAGARARGKRYGPELNVKLKFIFISIQKRVWAWI